MNESTQKWFNEWSNEYDQTLGKIKDIMICLILL